MTPKGKNAALWDESLAPQTLSTAEISNRHISLSNLWYIKYEGRRSGPYFSEDIRIHFKKNPSDSSEIFISNSHDKKWYPLSEFNIFDSLSRAENGPEATLDSSAFIVLSGGIQSGPMNGHELLKALEENKFLCTDLASTDGGKTWNKIAHYPLFTELNRPVLVLPMIPDSAKNDPATEWKLRILEKKAHEESVLNSIWSFGKAGEKASKKEIDEGSEPIQGEGERSYKLTFVAAVVAVMLLAGLFIQYSVLSGKFSVKKTVAKASSEVMENPAVLSTSSTGLLSGKNSEKKVIDKSKTRRSRSLDRSTASTGDSDGPALGDETPQVNQNPSNTQNKPRTFRKSRRSVSSTENEAAAPNEPIFDEPSQDTEPYAPAIQEEEPPQFEPPPQEMTEESVPPQEE